MSGSVDTAQERSTSGGRTAGELGALGSASAGIGAALAAGVASVCCTGPVVAPLVVAVLGAGGAAWAAGLKPYSGWILAGSGLLLGLAAWSLYGRAPAGCALPDGADTGTVDERRTPSTRHRVARAVVWVAGALWLVSLGLNVFLTE